MPCNNEGRLIDAVVSQEHKTVSKPLEAKEARKNSSTGFRDCMACPHLDLTLLVSRTVRGYIFVV